ncbi:hypothetical protein OKW43_004685 [Paraburkholderia sp. WC7.3g]
MKPVTIDMLRAHLLVASVTAAVASNCPLRWRVVLHLRLTGQSFVLAGH